MSKPVGNDVEYAEVDAHVVPGTSEAPARRGAWSLKVGVLFACSLLLVAVAALSVSSSAPAAHGSEHAPQEAGLIEKFDLGAVGDMLSNPEVGNVVDAAKDKVAGTAEATVTAGVEQASATAESALANAVAKAGEGVDAYSNATNASGLLGVLHDSLDVAGDATGTVVSGAGAAASGAVPVAQQLAGQGLNSFPDCEKTNAMIDATKSTIAAGVTAVDAAEGEFVSAINGTNASAPIASVMAVKGAAMDAAGSAMQ